MWAASTGCQTAMYVAPRRPYSLSLRRRPVFQRHKVTSTIEGRRPLPPFCVVLQRAIKAGALPDNREYNRGIQWKQVRKKENLHNRQDWAPNVVHTQNRRVPCRPHSLQVCNCIAYTSRVSDDEMRIRDAVHHNRTVRSVRASPRLSHP